VDREFRCCAGRIGRRAALELGICLALAPRLALAQTNAARQRSREGDLLVTVRATPSEPLKPDDLPLDGKQTFAWPMDPATGAVRNGSRLNKVPLLRLDPEGFRSRDQGAYHRRCRRLLGHMSAYGLRRHQLAPRSAAPRMPVPLLHLRSQGRGQDCQRTSSASPAGAAIENRRQPACRGQAVHRAGRFSNRCIKEIGVRRHAAVASNYYSDVHSGARVPKTTI
jgi:hypothetical protein